MESLKKAMQTYARQGGSSTIFVNDDGMQVCVLGVSVHALLSYLTRTISLSPRQNERRDRRFMPNIISAGLPDLGTIR